MKPQGRLIWVLGAIAILIATIALRNAVAWYGRPVPGVLVDAGGSVSSIGLPNWEGKRAGLRYPQKITPAGQPLAEGSRARVEIWDRAVAQAGSNGVLQATVYEEQGPRTVALPLRPLEPVAWWVYGGGPLIAGMLYASAGIIALWSSPRGRLARTFAVFSGSLGFFLLSLLDIHTQRSLAHVFFWSYAFIGSSLVMLVLRLPDDAPILRWFPRLELFAYLVCGLVAASASIAYELGRDTSPFQLASNWMLMLGGLFFTVASVVRYAKARGERRRALLPLLISMVPPYLVGAIGALLTIGFREALKSFTDILVFPATIFAPLASAYVFVRYDLWGSRALLSRIATHLVLGAVACIAAIALTAGMVASIGLSFRDAIAGATVSTLLAAALTAFARRFSDSTLFRSRAEYKPTIDQLSSELLTITSPSDVARAIERTVQRWLPCELVNLVLAEPSAFDGDSPRVEPPRPLEAVLRLPVAFGGGPLAWLDVGPKRGGALFAKDDVELLNTIANQGALAIAHAQAYQELEIRRKQQVDAWRGEREVLVETVAAEIAHEIRYPINYFRSVFERSAMGEKLDAEDVDVGREEVERLERLVAGLRRMAAHRVERSPVPVLELAERAEALLRDSLGKCRVIVDLPRDVVVRCDLDKMLQVVVNLLSNAVDAAGAGGTVGVSWQDDGRAGELVVWDTGVGFSGDPARLFAPWFTTKSRGTGLGLAITHRLVRAHGWTVSAQRRGERTTFVITIRREDILKPDSHRNALSEAEVA